MSVETLSDAHPAQTHDTIKTSRHWLGPIMALCDGLVVVALVYGVAGLYALVAYQSFAVDPTTPELAGMLATVFVFVNLMRGRYQIGHYLSSKGQFGQAVGAWTITLLAVIVFAFLAKVADHYSRGTVLAIYLLGIPVIAASRLLIARAVVAGSRSGRITAERIFLIGHEAEVMSFVDRHKPWRLGSAVIDVAFLKSPGLGEAGRLRLAVDLASAASICRAKRADAVFIAVPWSEQKTIEACIDAFMAMPVAIHLAPEKVLDRFAQPHIVSTGSLSSLRLTRPPLSMAEILGKRVFDLAAAGFAMMLLLPLFLAIAALIRLDSPGPVLFRQRRHGFNQQAFRIFKFRSMTTTDDGQIIKQATRDDPRITRIGRVLRRYNLDELPQLLNVVAGDMSLVGPRPHALAHDREFERKIALYARRHNVKPGITGWAQVNGLRGETDTDEKMAARIACDHWYIDNWSFSLDLAILFRTVFSAKAFRNAV